MRSGRLEAFSDGVLAIIITIMVLELHEPKGPTFGDLRELLPVGLAYAFSFVIVGIYWNNHHHLFSAVERVDGGVLWANLHLLFWLSLIPFATGWLGPHAGERAPVVLYGAVLLLSALAYFILTRALLRLHEPGSNLARALGQDWKGKVSLLICLAGLGAAFMATWVALLLYATIAVVWLVPDRRIHRVLIEPR